MPGASRLDSEQVACPFQAAAGPKPDIGKDPDSPTVTAGGLAGFRITVTDRSNVAARNWWVCDRMPRGDDFRARHPPAAPARAAALPGHTAAQAASACQVPPDGPRRLQRAERHGDEHRGGDPRVPRRDSWNSCPSPARADADRQGGGQGEGSPSCPETAGTTTTSCDRIASVGRYRRAQATPTGCPAAQAPPASVRARRSQILRDRRPLSTSALELQLSVAAAGAPPGDCTTAG